MATTEPPDKGNHTTTTPPGAEPPFGRIWQYHHRDGWREVDDPLHRRPGYLDEQLAAAGYDALACWDRGAASLSLSVYCHPPTDRYYVTLIGVLVYRAFAVADTPSLLALLPGLLAMVRDADALDEAERAHQERVKRKRRGACIYDPRRRQMRYPRAGEA